MPHGPLQRAVRHHPSAIAKRNHFDSPNALTSSPFFSNFLRRSAAKASGFWYSIVLPVSSTREMNDGSLMALRKASASASTIDFGVPGGATIAWNVPSVASKPSSLKVGVSG